MVTGISLLLIILAALIFIVIACSLLKWHPLLVLLITSVAVGLAAGMPADQLLTNISSGAGSVFASIGLIIALGTILGEFLEKTGATETIARWVITLSGKRRATRGTSILGGIVGIPVFCDSAFIILSNLGRSLSRQSGVSYGAISIALATALYTTHVLVPPTPGPLAAAGNLGATNELGLIIMLGLLFSIPSIWIGNLMANRLSGLPTTNDFIPEVESEKTFRQLPNLKRSLIPLLLPIVLITLGSVLPFFSLPSNVNSIFLFVSAPAVSLLISVLVSLLILPIGKHANEWIGKALLQAGPIIFITTAGGAFGAVLKATPLANLFEEWMNGQNLSPLAFFPIAFLLAAGLKTAQGSSTASLVITSSMLAPLLPALGMDQSLDKALLVLAIGAGAMVVSHANDSYFWVIQQYSGLPVRSMYRYFTLSTLFMGIAVLLMCMTVALIF